MKCMVCNCDMIQDRSLYECINCNHIFKNKPNNLEIQKEYHVTLAKNPIKFLPDGNIDPIFHVQREKIVTNRLNAIRKYLTPDMESLDVGGSAGTFADVLVPLVKNVEITDLADYQKKESNRLGYKFYQGDFNALKFNKQYDLITSWHVLEHIEDINLFMKCIKKIAKNLVIIEIPYNRKIKQNKFDGHVNFFNRESFEIFLSKYFDIIEIKEGVQKPALLAICKKRS